MKQTFFQKTTKKSGENPTQVFSIEIVSSFSTWLSSFCYSEFSIEENSL